MRRFVAVLSTSVLLWSQLMWPVSVYAQNLTVLADGTGTVLEGAGLGGNGGPVQGDPAGPSAEQNAHVSQDDAPGPENDPANGDPAHNLPSGGSVDDTLDDSTEGTSSSDGDSTVGSGSTPQDTDAQAGPVTTETSGTDGRPGDGQVGGGESGDGQDGGEQPGDNQFEDNQLSGNRPDNSHASGNQPGDNLPSGNRPGSDQPGNNSPSGNQQDSQVQLQPVSRVENSFRFVEGVPVKNEQPLLFSPAAELPTGATAWGIDVSEHSGAVDWQRVKEAGISFALLRLGAGAQDLDGQFTANVKGCLENGIPFGVYLYSFAWDADSASREAAWVLETLAREGLDPAALGLPVYLDLEHQVNAPGTDNHGKPAGVDGQGMPRLIEPAAFAQIAQSFALGLDAAGYETGVYASAEWWDAYLTDPVFDQWDRWVSQYGETLDHEDGAALWQLAGDVAVNGIDGAAGLSCALVELPALAEKPGDAQGQDGESDAPAPDEGETPSEGEGTDVDEDESATENDPTDEDGSATENDSAGEGASKRPTLLNVPAKPQPNDEATSDTSTSKKEESGKTEGKKQEKSSSPQKSAPSASKKQEKAKPKAGAKQSEKSAPAQKKPAKPAAPAGPMLVAEPHVRNLGWTGKVKNDAVIGTTGRALSLEALKLSLGSGAGKGGIEVRAHVASIGWQGWTSKMAGTTGRALAIEALQIRLTGEAAKKYDVWYRVHTANVGWLGWTSNSAKAGTEGMALAAEAVQVKILPKGSKAPGSTSGAYRAHTLIAQPHVRNLGWTGKVYDGSVIGTTGRALSLEALRLSLGPAVGSGGIQVRAHVASIGWQGWTGGTAGTTGRALAIEALQIRLTGEAAKKYDVWYRVHTANVGWLGWTSNSAKAGTEGMALAAEAVQVKILPKGSKAPGSTYDAYRNIPSISYQAFGSGSWLPAQGAWGTAGTTGKARPVYGFKLSINSTMKGSVSYRVHVANKGWQNAVGEGSVAGAQNSKNAIQAIRISLNGQLAQNFDIWYRVHVGGIGWMGWARNGASAGTEKCGLNVEAIQVVVKGKNSSAPGSTSRSFSSGTAGLPYIGYQTPGNFHKVSNQSVRIKNQGQGIHGYRTESRIPFNASRNDCVNAMITRAMEYVGTPYIWDYACAPGVGVDCAGLVLQALYATGMDLSPMNPWDHFYTPGHDAYANFMRTSARFKHVAFSQRQPGDLILTNGHVSIYMGNDKIIEAYPRAGVRWASVYSTQPILAVARPFS